jgi:hypothetical protein
MGNYLLRYLQVTGTFALIYFVDRRLEEYGVRSASNKENLAALT